MGGVLVGGVVGLGAVGGGLGGGLVGGGAAGVCGTIGIGAGVCCAGGVEVGVCGICCVCGVVTGVCGAWLVVVGGPVVVVAEGAAAADGTGTMPLFMAANHLPRTPCPPAWPFLVSDLNR